ncbi:MAG TPA: anthranilate synthase component I family protein [Caulobacteraceae bacterium]|nr:anthranilate synthase component I family protein [Caulobacteraceae bacterium]
MASPTGSTDACWRAAACWPAIRSTPSAPGCSSRTLTCIDSPPTLLRAAWRDPVDVAAAFADEPFALCLISDGAGERGRWSYFARDPDDTLTVDPHDPVDAMAALARLLGPTRPTASGGPPFQGGVAGLAAYEFGDRLERLGLARLPPWPDLACARYDRLLAFDHRDGVVFAIGADPAAAGAAQAWLGARDRQRPTRRLVTRSIGATPAAAHEAAVADIIGRIAAGEIFQANLARAWSGLMRFGCRPFDLFARLVPASPAPFAAYLRLSGLAVVSNSPERFLRVTPCAGALIAETRPIKGTVPRGATPAEDERLVAELAASEKDRAENLMIVDLMRNDLARTATPGAVRVPELFAVERFANVSHLVSTVTAQLAPGRTALDAFAAAFPPGSITGAPKVQAMKVIAKLEPPRGPFFGAMFWAGFDGAFDSNVLIRTAAFRRRSFRHDGFPQPGPFWFFETRAGGGIVADSEPAAERRETEAKIAAILSALTT